MDKKALKTDCRLEREARELAIYNEWNALIGEPGAMRTAIDMHLMEKYNIHAASTIWFIRKRVEKRLAADRTGPQKN